MKPFKDYEKTQVYADVEKLPSGYYVGRILNAEEKQNRGSGSRLEISVDITEGEFKGYYKENYRNQPFENKKWKGVLTLFTPTDDGSERDGWTKRAFKTSISAVEDSNNGYRWDWNEAKLKGLDVGLAVRQEEYDVEGRKGWSAKIFRFVSVEDVRGGKLKTPEDKPLKNSKSTSAANYGDFTPVNDDDLPF